MGIFTIIMLLIFIYNRMLQLKEQCGTENYDECSFSQSNAEVQACRYLQPSILNKSCMHSVSFVDCKLKQFPDLPVNTQKLDLSKNSLSTFPLALACLKQIKINNNLIERIPEQINDIATLRIIRANSNNISIIPFLQHVRHLQLNRNPIKMITTQISETRLQFISFDWLPYLIQSTSQAAEQNSVYALCDIIQQARLDSMTYFVSFQTLFEQRKSNINDVSCLVYKAINEKSDWFVDFLRDHDSQINFNALLYSNRPLLQFVFEQGYQKGLSLFMIKKSNLNAPEVYMVNLILACKYNQIEYFNYVVGHGLKRFVIKENEDQIIQTIFRNFDDNRLSLEMLIKIMYLSNYNQTNKKVFRLPTKISIMEAQRICDGLTSVMLDQRLDKLFDFRAAVQEESLQPLLHFAMTYRKPELVKIILQRYRKPFSLNFAGKSAKNIRGSAFSRKLIWKYEKLFIKQHFQNQHVQLKKKKEKQRQRWLNVVYSSPKNSNHFSSASKNNQTQQSLMGTQIKSVQKSIHQRKAIHRLRANRNKQIQIPQFDPFQCINDKDQTGIIFDFALNSQRNLNYFTTNQLVKRINKDVNSLSIYQAFQRSALNTIERDFTKQITQKQGRSSFILSPFRACQDIDLSQNEKQQYILSKQEQKKQYICFTPCNQVSNSGDISENNS